MDDLKRLKKDWQENQNFPKLNQFEIYKILAPRPLPLKF